MGGLERRLTPLPLCFLQQLSFPASVLPPFPKGQLQHHPSHVQTRCSECLASGNSKPACPGAIPEQNLDQCVDVTNRKPSQGVGSSSPSPSTLASPWDREDGPIRMLSATFPGFLLVERATWAVDSPILSYSEGQKGQVPWAKGQRSQSSERRHLEPASLLDEAGRWI